MALTKPAELCITEQWIRERVNLDADALVAVRSLALPGTYHQKITRLGRSLLSFTRIKHLDLSRNAIETLEGLAHLVVLETLNLYYNNVPDLREVFRLRHNTKLKELDMRLNPVTKNEPDYRMFTVHMLPGLRRLDDRSVSEGERKAALMHFNSDQAHQFDDSVRSSVVTPPLSPPPVNQLCQSCSIASRKTLVRSIAPPSSGLGADTEELLELMAEQSAALFNHNPLLATPPPPPPAQPRSHSGKKQQPSSSKQAKQHHSQTREPTGLEFTDEFEAYTERHPLLHFTPCPPNKELTEQHGSQTNQPGPSHEEEEGEEEREEEREGLEVEGSSVEDAASCVANIMRHMNRHPSRTDAAKGEIIDYLQRWLKASLDQQLQHHREVEEEEVNSLRKQVQLQAEELTDLRKMVSHSKEVEELLQQAHTQMEAMRRHCQQLLEENQMLKTASDSVVSERFLSQTITDISSVKHQQQHLMEEVHQLSERLTQHLNMSSQQQQLASLLQESHQCLMVAHEHILKEEEVLRQQHQVEVEQLKRNYDLLRKTLGLLQNHPH